MQKWHLTSVITLVFTGLSACALCGALTGDLDAVSYVGQTAKTDASHWGLTTSGMNFTAEAKAIVTLEDALDDQNYDSNSGKIYARWILTWTPSGQNDPPPKVRLRMAGGQFNNFILKRASTNNVPTAYQGALSEGEARAFATEAPQIAYSELLANGGSGPNVDFSHKYDKRLAWVKWVLQGNGTYKATVTDLICRPRMTAYYEVSQYYNRTEFLSYSQARVAININPVFEFAAGQFKIGAELHSFNGEVSSLFARICVADPETDDVIAYQYCSFDTENPAGTFLETTLDVADGTYDIYIQVPGWLTAKLNDVEIEDGGINDEIAIDLYPGDLDGDGQVF